MSYEFWIYSILKGDRNSPPPCHQVLDATRLGIRLLLNPLKALGLVKGDTGCVCLVNRQLQLVAQQFGMADQLFAQTLALMGGINKQGCQLITHQRVKALNPG